MSALTVDHASGNSPEWDDLVRIWEQADAREGWKVEIIEAARRPAGPRRSDPHPLR
ncbi:hypothetical protein MUU72_08005 [Streptomyces sp. RS10V-4]|uniref:hypothetical protein n=1 Tax=Streptomyces rhizoryzae TaxID=2932493 RepID=UPI0020045635|nr:hypothetical protein [Streptomyces rhizoryzae]MCK7623042.1 hypothetical protein [Streptomyces rhizoryzae]